METWQFKSLFDEIAKMNSFKKDFGGWFTQSNECVLTLDLQKSNYANYYELNIKVYVHGMFGKEYIISKELIKKDTGDVFRRQPKEFNDVLDLDNPMIENLRKERLHSLFANFITPFTKMALSKSGIKKLAEDRAVILLPAVKAELSKLMSENQ